MWILKPSTSLELKTSGKAQLNFLFQQDKFYIMDNHLAAGWCWLNELDKTKSYNLFHIDQHWDLWNKSPKSSYEFLLNHKKISLKEFVNLTYTDSGTDKKLKVFNYANYILTLHNLFPNWFEHSIFACDGYQKEMNDLNVFYNPYSYELPNKFGKWINNSPLNKDSEKNNNQWLVNIDIDYFFRSDQYQMYTDAYIIDLCLEIKANLDRIAVVTIALSPEHCGSWKESLRVANIMAKVFDIDFDIQSSEPYFPKTAREYHHHN